MLKKRLIPVLLLQDGMLVRSQGFTEHQVIGAPVHEVRRFNEWNVDELVYLDIGGTHSALEILGTIAETCFMPLAFGGRIQSAEQMREILARGADKVVINSAAFRTPELIAEGARTFGNQAIVVSIDVMQGEVVIDGGRTRTGRDPIAWAREAE